MSSPFPHMEAKKAEHEAAAAKGNKNNDWSPFSKIAVVISAILVFCLQAIFVYKVAVAYQQGKLQNIDISQLPQQISDAMFAQTADSGVSSENIIRRQLPVTERFFVEIGWASEDLKNSPIAKHVEEEGWSGVCVVPFANDLSGRSCKVVAMPVGPKSGEKVFAEDCSGSQTGLAGMMNRLMGEEECRSAQATTVSVSMVLEITNAPKIIDYMSLNTHGSELQILRTFPFDTHCVSAWSIDDSDSDNIAAIKHFLEVSQGCRIHTQQAGVWARCPCDKTGRHHHRKASPTVDSLAETKDARIPQKEDAVKILATGTIEHDHHMKRKGHSVIAPK